MPMRNVPECDVFGTRGDDVFGTTIAISRDGVDNIVIDRLLSERAYRRLLAALEPPKTRNKAPKP